MNMNVSKTNGVKLLAAVMVMAMVFAGAAVVLSDSEVNAAPVKNDLINVSGGSLPDNAAYSGSTLTLTGYTGIGFYSDRDLTIKISGSNTIEADRAGEYAGNAYSAIYVTGKITIIADDANDASVVDSLAIKVTGVSTQTGVSESTYGIYATGGIDIKGIAVDIDVSTNDPLAFAIAGNEASTFTNVTGTIDGGNRAIQVGNYKLTLKGCDLTLTGGEKAIQANNASSEVLITSNGDTHSNIVAKLNGSYGGPQSGQNDGYGVKARVLQVDANNSLTSDGIHVFNVGGGANAKLDGNVTINDYSYAFSSDVNVDGYTPGFTMDADTTTTIGSTGKVVNNSTIVSKGALTNGGNLANNGTFINNAIVTNNGTFNNYGALYSTAAASTLTNNSVLYNAGQIYSNKEISNITGSPVTAGFGISNNMDAIDSDLPLSGYAFLTSDLIIPQNKSITVGSNATLDLRGYTLTVEGTLTVEMGGSIIGYSGDADNTDNEILLTKGTIVNNGAIGSGQVPVKVSASATSYVQMLNVEGVSFGTTTVGESKTTVLTITGDVITSVSASNNYVFNIAGAYITGEMTISDEITTTILTGNAIVSENATLTIDGEISGVSTEIQMLNNSTVNVMGACSVDITAGTGKAASTNYKTPAITTVTLDNVTGVTLTVTSTSAVEQVGDSSVRYTTRVLNIEGTTDLIDENSKGTITVANADDSTVPGDGVGLSYVPAEATLSIPEDVSADLGGTEVLGTVVYVDNNSVDGYVGTQYSIREGTETTYYVKTFTGALEQIADAYRNTIYVHGPVEVEADFTLATGQTIDIVENAYTIATEATVTVQSGARISGAVEEVEGMLILQRGAPDVLVNKYAVFSTSTDGTRTYSGLAAALANSAAGDEITVIGQGYTTVEVEGNISIPADRTVIVQKAMSIEGNLVVEEGATLNNQATITMTGERSTVTVNGVMDNTSASTVADPVVFSNTAGNKANRGIYSTGEFIVTNNDDLALGGTNNTSVNAYVNGAVYTNADNELVVTTFAKAVAAIADLDDKTINVIGTVSETGDITVGNGVDETTVIIGIYEPSVINLHGLVTLGNVTLDYATIEMNTANNNTNGRLTATVSGEYGVEGSTSVASVTLSQSYGVTITNDSEPNELAETVWFNTIGGTFQGTVTVSAGTVELDDTASTKNYGVTGENSLSVASGATLVVPETVTLNLSKNITVSGTLTVEGSVAVAQDTEATIDGTVDVEGSIVVDDKDSGTNAGVLVINGTLNIVEDGTATVDGIMRLGAKPTTLGASSAVMTGTVTVSGKIIAYAGSDVSGAQIVSAPNTPAKYTTYTINDIVYATVYGSGNITEMNDEISQLKDLNIAANAIEWTDASGTVITPGAIGSPDAVYAEIAYKDVQVTISIGTGISLSVDNIIINSYNGKTYPLAIGTHTVSVVTNPGYTGDVTITFNGQTVTDGTIEITSDMYGQTVVLSAGGNITVDSGASGSSDGMGLTEILLIILVILIVVMAIMVALRLMRS